MGSNSVLTIKRGAQVPGGHWQDLINREQNNDSSLLSFSGSKTLGGTYRHRRSGSTSRRGPEVVARYSPPKLATSTLPRNIGKMKEDPATELEKLRLPQGIEELEKMYAPMKNLNRPLPNNAKQWGAFPAPHPLNGGRDDDQESEICSVIADIPPPLAPVQSHALLEETFGHQLPPVVRKTPVRKLSSEGSFGKTPPLPPRRTSSKLSLFPSRSSSSGIYANSSSLINRASLMSTGSSGESSGSSGHDALSPTTPLTESEVFSWPPSVWSGSHSPGSEQSDQNLRSVSQMGEGSGSENGSSKNVYVRMNKREPESDYISVLYSAVQRQGGGGSVETAISPYLRMMKEENEKCQSRLSDFIYATPEPKSLSRSSSRTSRRSIKRSKMFKDLLKEVERKRKYRVGLNLFNSKPEIGIEYLVKNDFLDLSPSSVAKFLHEKNSGLAKDKVGEYLGNLQSPFAMKVLTGFMDLMDFTGLRIDKGLRKLLHVVRVPGEAQKIERIMEVFAKRYAKCNPGMIGKLKSHDSLVVLSFAVMLLNTDLHTKSVKDEKKMKVTDFIRNLESVDNFDQKLLKSIYKSIKKQEFRGGLDHVGQTQMIQTNIVQSKRPQINLVEPHRRLVCLCKLYEVTDINSTKKEAADHQRDIFLFNDLLVVTKENSSRSSKKNPTYAYKDSFNLSGLEVSLFHTPVFDYGIQVIRKATGCILLTLNAGSEHDRYKFVMDLQESIFEMNQMEEAMAQHS